MLIRCTLIIAFTTIISVALGCSGTKQASEQSLLEKNWGRSLETIYYKQMINPDASKNLDPVVGLDGNASVNNVNKYQDSFKKAEPQKSQTILKLQ